MIGAARGLGLLACGLIAGVALASGGLHAEPIRGAGSTFAAPAITAWSRSYQEARADGGDFVNIDWTVDYERLGSLGGILRLAQPEMDFAASDAPLPPEDLARFGHLQFPFVMGGVAVAHNLDGVAAGALKLTGVVLADIYLGRVNRWNDAAIVALNPGLALPDLPISVLHRKDGSGSTQTFTEYLSLASAEWKSRYGADTLISWPVGVGVEGSGGVIAAVQGTSGAIGYVEYGQMRRAGLKPAAMGNAAGAFVPPEAAAFAAAAAAAPWDSAKGFYLRLTDTTAPDAYPLTAATYALVPVARLSSGRRARTLDFFRHAFAEGDEEALSLGFVPMPDAVVGLIEAEFAKVSGGS